MYKNLNIQSLEVYWTSFVQQWFSRFPLQMNLAGWGPRCWHTFTKRCMG